MKKKVLFSLVVNLLLIIGINNVKAVTVTQAEPSRYLYYSGNGATVTWTTSFSEAQQKQVDFFRYKHDENNLAYVCESGPLVQPPYNTPCSYISSFLGTDKSIGTAYIIQQILGTPNGLYYTQDSSNYQKYFWAEITALAYLGASGQNYQSKYGNITIASNKTMNQIINEAKNYSTKYSKSVNITLSSSSFTFSLDSSGNNYVSNKIYIKDTNGNAGSITVTKTGDYSKFSFTNNTDSSGHYLQYSIPKSSFTGSLTVGVKVSTTNSYYGTESYNCAPYQDVMSSKLHKLSKSDEATASGTVKHETGKLTVKKVDASGNAVAGAELQVSCPKSGLNTSFITATTDKVFTNLEVGDVCTVTELHAPSKYVKITTSTVATVTVSGVTATVTNKLNKVSFSKVNSSGTYVSGATLEIRTNASDAGTVQSFCGGTCRWTSGTSKKSFEGIPAGTYYLVETVAPSGYLLTDPVKFTVESDSTTPEVSVTMTDKKNKVSFSKINSSGAYISGAKLEIRTNASDAGTVQNFCGGTCRWTSGTSKKTFEGIPAGTYYLVETEAPSGYILASPVQFTVSANSTTAEVSVTMTNNKNELYISKQSLTDKKILPGATLEIRDASCTVVQNFCQEGDSTLCRWKTGDSDKKIVGVPSGTYCLVETSAPDGYVLAEKQTFKIESGKNPAKVIMYNKLNELHISKKSLTNKKVLPGAKLEIRDSGCKTVEKFCKDEKGNATACVWESTDEEKVIFGVPSGTYCLVETVAPDGYVLSTEEVKFKIESGKNPKLVEMFNKLTSVQIYKLNEETGEPLKGAKLQIQDKDGKMLYEWISTEEPYEILGLKKGTYYLVEIEAPDGYEKYSGKIEFTVDGEKDVVELELNNKPEYDVPDTLGGKSALLIAFAMFDIAIGIGIILYVRKNKAQE